MASLASEASPSLRCALISMSVASVTGRIPATPSSPSSSPSASLMSEATSPAFGWMRSATRSAATARALALSGRSWIM